MTAKHPRRPDAAAEWLKLDRQLCFALYSSSLAMTKLYKPLLEPLGLTYPQYLVMLVLWEGDAGAAPAPGDGTGVPPAGAAPAPDARAQRRAPAGDAPRPGAGLTVSELGARLRLDSGTLTPLLKRLEAAGLVQRRRDRDDERRVLLTLTAAGRALRERALEVPRQVVCAAQCSLDELSALTARLQRLRDEITGFHDRLAA